MTMLACVRTAIAAALLAAGSIPATAESRVVRAPQPDLALFATVVAAGRERSAFAALTLIDTLAGSRGNAIVAAAVRAHGAADVKQGLRAIDFAVEDARRELARAGHALPAAPPHDEIHGTELVDALYRAGSTSATRAYRLDTMLDRLVSHAVSVKVTRDVDRHFGAGTLAACHDMLVRAIADADAGAAAR